MCTWCVTVESTSTLHHLVDFALDVELWVFGLHTFQFDGNLLSNGDVSTQVDVSKRPASNFPAQSVSVSYSQLHDRRSCGRLASKLAR